VADEQRIVAVLHLSKETKGTRVFLEPEQGSPHVDAIAAQLNIYIPKSSSRQLLGDPDTVTIMIEPGDQTQS
jgi:hypothetical protein